MGPPRTVPQSQVTSARISSGPRSGPVQAASSLSKELPVPCERREFDVFVSPREIKPIRSVNVAWAVRHPDELFHREPIRVKTGQRDVLAKLEGLLEDDHPVVALTPMGAMLDTIAQYLLQHKGKNTVTPQSSVPVNQPLQALVDSEVRSSQVLSTSAAVLLERE